ncbi:hypothetical protein ACJIZ3_002409 [Penstemon smallii]|uniref:Uncharacterized protein n=1 Tax=Penstemon smallii TaxID=265156 RepID=A0ABD3U7W1_9LAMI
MHHFAVKNNLFDTNEDTTNVQSLGNNGPICPKPRRPSSALPSQFLDLTVSCNKHCEMYYDGRSAIQNTISNKKRDGGGGGESPLATCEWLESPPGRTENPLVHDVHFLRVHHQYDHMNIFPPYTTT